MITRKKYFSRLVAALLLALPLAPDAFAAKDPVYTAFFSNEGAGGYDVTAYFSENNAVKGSKDFSTEYNGAEWLFASQENLDKFLADPEQYVPQYGGYCAWAVAQGDTAKGDPEQWTVHNGKLYLNYNAEIQEKWTADRDQLIQAADGHWPTVLD